MACPQLDPDLRCLLYGQPERPTCCSGLQASEEMCGGSREHALDWLATLEAASAPTQALPSTWKHS